jgi:type II secretion system protein N
MVPVPELTLGNLKLELPVSDGKVELKNTRLAGTDLEVALDGAITLAPVVGRSNVSLMLGLKPTEKLLSSDPLLRPILKNFESSKDSEGFFGLAVSGTLGSPRAVPRRR